MKQGIILAAIAAMLAAGPAHANEELAKKSACTSCHAIDKRTVGPGFREVAARYRNDKTAEERLFAKVKAGGTGVWGQVPMPPNTGVPDADIRKLVHWILGLK
jgi:cytochrome c